MTEINANSDGNVHIEKKGDKIIITIPVDDVLKGTKVEEGKLLDFCNCSSVLGAVASFI